MNTKYALLLLLLPFALLACKKNNSGRVSGGGFFKIYDVPVARNNKSNNTTIASSGAMAGDANGNIYVWYFDSSISTFGRLAILKADSKGNKIWNRTYIPMEAGSIDVDLNNNYYFNENLVCIGQNLFICGRDSANSWQILKIRCSDGTLIAEFPFANLQPAYRDIFRLFSMWGSSDGNLLISAWTGNTSGFETPVLYKMDPNGTLIWENNNFPGLADSGNYNNIPYCMTELTDGNYLYGTIAYYNYSDSSGNSLTSSGIRIYQLNNSGTIVSVDSLYQGTYNGSGFPAFINSNGAAQIFRIYPSLTGGYLILSMETYDYDQDCRIKILKTTASFTVTDSSYISLGNSVISATAQGRDGSVIMSVFNQVLPLPNAVCIVYKIAPDGSVSRPVEIGLPKQSAFISGVYPNSDGHIYMTGLIQSGNIDINNLFILKTDNNEHF